MNRRLALLACLVLAPAAALAVTEQRNWQREFSVTQPQPRLLVRNIWGPVSVVTGSADVIVVRAKEIRSAGSAGDLERSRQILTLQVDQDDRGVSLVLPKGEDRWWSPLEGCDECRLYLALEIQVPAAADIDVATVMDGSISVAGVTGAVQLDNVNGDIDAAELVQCSRLQTVNGDVTVRFARQPRSDCSLETVNGDMQVGLPGSPDLTLAIVTGNGRIRSDFDARPVALEMTVDKQRIGDTNRYRVEQPAGLQIGSGGPRFQFKSINGDVEIFRHE
ncbi:MAG: hypothetical protein QNJ40_06705 [Xanthomonadales bacterium]|nr:hypothetical protein [Xanthomonadales bacterium]